VRRPQLAGTATVALALAVAAVGCSGADHGAVTDVTLPSSLSIPTTVPGGSTSTVAPAPSTTTVPPTNPEVDGAPVILSLVAEPGAAACSGGTIPALVRFELAPEPPVRVVTVFLDASRDAAAAANSGTSLTIPAVPCDGGVHQVLFIATGTGSGADVRSSTQAVAFQAPAAG